MICWEKNIRRLFKKAKLASIGQWTPKYRIMKALPETRFLHILPLWITLASVMLHQTEPTICSPILQKRNVDKQDLVNGSLTRNSAGRKQCLSIN